MQLFNHDSFDNINSTFDSDLDLNISDEQNEANTIKIYDTSLYLSYALLDKRIVNKTADFFRTIHKNIKVDMMINPISERVSVHTSRAVKNKIIRNDKFVFLATSTSIFSKWVNWELGIADCYKAKDDKIVILPVADKNSRWLGDVYFKLYPRIERLVPNPSIKTTCLYRVVYPNGSTKPLNEWLLA